MRYAPPSVRLCRVQIVRCTMFHLRVPLPEHAVCFPVLLRVAYHGVAAVDDICSNHVLLASLPNGLALVKRVLRNRVGVVVSFGSWNFFNFRIQGGLWLVASVIRGSCVLSLEEATVQD